MIGFFIEWVWAGTRKVLKRIWWLAVLLSGSKNRARFDYYDPLLIIIRKFHCFSYKLVFFMYERLVIIRHKLNKKWRNKQTTFSNLTIVGRRKKRLVASHLSHLMIVEFKACYLCSSTVVSMKSIVIIIRTRS